MPPPLLRHTCPVHPRLCQQALRYLMAGPTATRATFRLAQSAAPTQQAPAGQTACMLIDRQSQAGWSLIHNNLAWLTDKNRRSIVCYWCDDNYQEKTQVRYQDIYKKKTCKFVPLTIYILSELSLRRYFFNSWICKWNLKSLLLSNLVLHSNKDDDVMRLHPMTSGSLSLAMLAAAYIVVPAKETVTHTPSSMKWTQINGMLDRTPT